MEWLTFFGLGAALAMDSFAVSLTNGFLISDLKLSQALRIAFSFGLFQALMPVIGWAAGTTFTTYIASFDHWIAFGLLSVLGGKMIYEARFLKKDGTCSDDDEDKKNCLHLPTLLLLSIATSIDALAVGITISFMDTGILFPAAVIGSVTFVLCLAGIYIGRKAGHFFEDKLELIGGIVLIGIGIKILIEGLLAG